MQKVFLSYAPEDREVFSAFLKDAAKQQPDFELIYTTDKEARQEEWMGETKIMIDSSDAVFFLVTKYSKLSEPMFWEMKCANASGKPMLALFAGGAGIMDKPMDIRLVTAMVLSWDRLKDFISRIG